MPFYEELLARTEHGRQYLLSAPIIDDVMKGQFSLETYIAFLNQAYHHVRHTVPLLMTAGGKLAEHQKWAQRIIHEYIEEEYGHEEWILNDLVACGCDRMNYEYGCSPYTSEMLIAFLYDYVNRINPLGIFGMVLVLEGTSSTLAPTVARIVQQKLDLPDAAMTYLTTHGELDQSHIGYFERAMNQVTDTVDQAAIVHVADRVYRLYGDIYRAIPEAAKLVEERSAA